MKTLAITAFKARCLAVMDEVARTGESVVVLKRGRPFARVLPAVEAGPEFPQRRLIGTVEAVGDVVSPVLPPGAWEAEGRIEGRRRRARVR